MCNHLNKTYWTCVCSRQDWHCQDCGQGTGHACSRVADEIGAKATFTFDQERYWRKQIAKEIEEEAAKGKWLSTRPYKDTTDKWQLHYLSEGMEMAAAIARGQK